MNVVFDLDGTLIDSAPDIQYVASLVLGDLELQPLTLDETRQFIGEGSAVFVRRMMSARNIAEVGGIHERLHHAFLQAYENAVDKAQFYPHVLEVLTGLQRQGHKLGLCTNKPEKPTRSVLQHMQLEPFFSAVMAGGMSKNRKPAPDMLLEVIAEMGTGLTLYIGDSEIDAETAHRAGIPFALYSEGYRKTDVNKLRWDWTFDDFRELPAIVEQLAAENAVSE